jgi:hypothetical protein
VLAEVTSDAELRYMRMFAEILLHGPLPLDDHDRVRVQGIHHAVRGALAERAVEQIGGP